VFSLRVILTGIEAHHTGNGQWVTILEGPTDVDLVGVAGVEQVLGEASLVPGKYTQVRLVVVGAETRIGTDVRQVMIPAVTSIWPESSRWRLESTPPSPWTSTLRRP
jgi:hypothetical protein